MITVSKSLLIPALERCVRVAPSKGDTAIQSHIKLDFDDVLTYQVTNLVTSIRGSIDASGDPVKFTVNVRELLAASQSVIGDNVKLSLAKNGKLTVSGEGKRLFTCQTLSADDFPVIELETAEWTELPAETLRSLVSRVMFACGAASDERQSIKNIRVRALDGILSAASANGHALGFASDAIESLATVTAVIPRSGVSSLLSTSGDKIDIAVTPQSVLFRNGPETLIIRTTIGEFPPVDTVIEQCLANNTKKATVSATAFIEALSAIRRIESKADIDLTFSKGELKIESGKEDEVGYATDLIENLGEDNGEVRVAAEYLTGSLKGLGNVTMSFGVDLDPFTITDGMFTAIIMPLRKDK
jgi:DNA polymerase III sliding clamp (beta) subunit (PCNA family)